MELIVLSTIVKEEVISNSVYSTESKDNIINE